MLTVIAASNALGLGIDEPLARNASGTTYFYEADGLGSVTSITDTSGAIADSNIYDSFGSPYYTTGTVPNPFKFTARELDTETGLYYYRARYYDQTTGRFLSEDPIGFDGGTNFYPYAGNDPVDFTDHSGLDYHLTLEGNTIVVSASVTIYGPNATSELAKVWQRDVNRYWNAPHFRYGNCDVRFNVSFSADPAHNWSFTASPSSDNLVYVVKQQGNEHLLDQTWSSYGRWLSGLVDQDVAHAMGHFFHLKDDYSLLFGTKKGHEGHIMSNDLIRNVAQHEVEDIVSGYVCGCKK